MIKFGGFPGGSDGKESTCSVGDLGSILGLERCPGKGNSISLQRSGLENSMGRGARQATTLCEFHFESISGKL